MTSQIKEFKNLNLYREADTAGTPNVVKDLNALKNIVFILAQNMYNTNLSYSDINSLSQKVSDILNLPENTSKWMNKDIGLVNNLVKNTLIKQVNTDHPDIKSVESSEEGFKALGGDKGLFKRETISRVLNNLESFSNNPSAWTSLLGIEINVVRSSIENKENIMTNLQNYFSKEYPGKNPEDPYYCLKIGAEGSYKGKRAPAEITLKLEFDSYKPNFKLDDTSLEQLNNESINSRLDQCLNEAYSYIDHLEEGILDDSSYVAQLIEGYFFTRAEQQSPIILKIGPADTWKSNWKNVKNEIKKISKSEGTFSLSIPLYVFTQKVAEDNKIAKAKVISSLDDSKEKNDAKKDSTAQKAAQRAQKIDDFTNTKLGKVAKTLGGLAGIRIGTEK